ncbi:MAG: PAS domain S-box protein [Candidatus Hodarchaeota archaeon]
MILDQKDFENLEAQFKFFMDSIDDLVAVLEPTANYRIEQINRNSFLEKLGYSYKDVIGRSIINFVYHEDSKKAIKSFKKEVDHIDRIQELRLKGSAGEIIWTEIKTKKFKNELNEKRILIIIKDITKRKKIEEELKIGEERFKKITESIPEIRFWKLFNPKKYEEALQSSYEMLQTVMENIPQYVYWKDNDLNYLGCNNNYANLIGVEYPENIINKKDTDLLYDDQQIYYNQKKEKDLIDSDKAEFNVIESWILRNGKKIWVQINRIPLYDSDENVVGILVTFEDVTERKKSEENLKESEKKYRNLIESSPFAILLFDIDGRIIDYNTTTEKLFGYKKGEYIGKTYEDLPLYPPEIFSVLNKKLRKLYKGGEIGPTEFQVYKRDGTYAWVNAELSLIKLADKTYFQAIAQDITEKKEAEQKLKLSELKYKTLIENIPDVIYSSLPDEISSTLFVSSRWDEWTGYSPEEMYNNPELWKQSIHPDDREVTLKEYKIAAEKKEEFIIEYRVIHKDTGQEYFLRDHGVPILDNNNNIVSYDGVITNITERIKAEEMLKDSEEKYRNLLDTSTVGILEINIENMEVTFINPKLLEITGYFEAESLGNKFIQNIIHPDDLNKVLKSSEDKDLEFRIVTKDGKLKWLHGRRWNQYDESGEPIGFRLWLEDITEKKMYEELIYELNINFLNFSTDTRKNIELLLKTSLKLLDGKIAIYANKIEHDGDKLFRVMTSEGEVMTLPITDFMNNFYISELFNENHDFPQIFYDIDKIERANKDKFIKENNIKALYGKLVMSQNELNDMMCVLYPENPLITNQDKLVLFLICDAIEIEQRRWQVQQHLEEQAQELSEINRLKTDLFSRTSHELKTPLISIKGFTELLLTLHANKFDDEIISILNEIMKGSRRLEDYINTIVESSKLEQGLMKLNKIKEDLSFIVKECITELESNARLRSQTILNKVKNNLITLLDKEGIKEVISNLLINAIKYTPVGGEITIESQTKDDLYVISVKDTGIGLTDEEKKHLFTQFGKIERYGQGWDVGIEGTGLGLYISKEIVELHGGKIWAESKGRNKGSTFYFSLPILKNH